MRPASPSSPAPRLLITRLSHIGDCILTIPLLNALRLHFPRALIAWVVESPAASLLRGLPALDKLIVVRPGWRSSPRAAWSLVQQVRAHRFDICLDPQGLNKSSLIGYLSGAPVRIGHAAPRGREWSPWLNNHLVSCPALHLVDHSLQLLSALSVTPHGVSFDIPSDPAAEAYVRSHLSRDDPPGGLAIINPGANWPTRRWEPTRFGQVAAYLGQQRSLQSWVIWHGETERAMAQQIVFRSSGQARLAPPTSLTELTALLRKARLYVGCDTGPTHLAAAVGTPCVSLHGPTCPSQSGPYGHQHRTVQVYLQSGSLHERRYAQNHAMRAIDVTSVCRACDQVLDRDAGAARRSAG